jgi:Cdc6-like AAA superfamily ATPase
MKEYGLIAKFLSMGICFILISDAEENSSLLTENKRSNIPSMIRLPSYSSEQTYEIIKDRAEKSSCQMELYRRNTQRNC